MTLLSRVSHNTALQYIFFTLFGETGRWWQTGITIERPGLRVPEHLRPPHLTCYQVTYIHLCYRVHWEQPAPACCYVIFYLFFYSQHRNYNI